MQSFSPCWNIRAAGNTTKRNCWARHKRKYTRYKGDCGEPSLKIPSRAEACKLYSKWRIPSKGRTPGGLYPSNATIAYSLSRILYSHLIRLRVEGLTIYAVFGASLSIAFSGIGSGLGGTLASQIREGEAEKSERHAKNNPASRISPWSGGFIMPFSSCTLLAPLFPCLACSALKQKTHGTERPCSIFTTFSSERSVQTTPNLTREHYPCFREEII